MLVIRRRQKQEVHQVGFYQGSYVGENRGRYKETYQEAQEIRALYHILYQGGQNEGY